jgi:hypothetical protein
MKKTMQGITYFYPLDRRSKIKCEGYRGSYTIIDAAIYKDEVYVLLEHDWYGDETALLLAVLPDCYRWYVIEGTSGKTTKRFFIAERDILGETYESIDDALLEHYVDAELDEIDILTDEEINNVEVK